MRKVILTITILFICFFVPNGTLAQTQPNNLLLLQQIEILKREIEVFKSIIANFNLRQTPTAGAFSVVRLSDDKVLLEKNPNQTYTIASITKLMTAVVASENITNGQTITLTEEMLKPLGSSPVLFSGLNINKEDLLRAALIQSSNDAAEALASFQSKATFLTSMNQKAKELGMENTIFFDANGLNPANHSTTSDLAKLVSYVYKQHPELLQITKSNDFWLPDATGHRFKFQNVNNFYPLSEFIGGKTGYLVEAKQTIASVFAINGEPTAIVLLHSDNRQADVFAILNQLKSSL